MFFKVSSIVLLGENMKYVLMLLLVIPFVSADIVIHQVLYDPVKTESGGEAVELRNTGLESVDVSGWVLATESSATDATIPDSTILAPGSVYLIADEGWDDNKDNPDWRPADHVEKITLNNADGGIALVHDGSIVDAAGWGDAEGIEAGLFEGSPAEEVEPGKALVRLDDTDDNSADLIAMPADFLPGVPVLITADAIITGPVIEISESLHLNPEGKVSVKNNGDEVISVTLLFNDLYFDDYTISKNALSVDTTEFVVEPGEFYEARVTLDIPSDAVPGTYRSTLRVVIEK